jgi:DNA-binding CsgD family transcriptional regulator
MKPELKKLHEVWQETTNKPAANTQMPRITFSQLTNSVISTGPFYYYIIDFFDMSLSHVSASIRDIHGFDPASVSFNDILLTMHPDEMDFVAKAEASVAEFFYKNLDRSKLLKYKISYNFQMRLADGQYVLMNHQALMLTLDSNGGYGKSLNIHTRIDHLSNHNTFTYSLIGLDGEPSFMKLRTDNNQEDVPRYSKREIDIIRLLADGLTNVQIGERLFISELTVKKHRTNILAKSDCSNTAQLVKMSVLTGLI